VGLMRGSDVLRFQPRTPEFSEACTRGASCTCRNRACGCIGKVTACPYPARGIDDVIAAGCPRSNPYPHLAGRLRRKLSSDQATQGPTSRNELSAGKAAIARRSYRGGRVAAASIAVRESGAMEPAASALSVACHSLSRQLATEFRVTGKTRGTGPMALVGNRAVLFTSHHAHRTAAAPPPWQKCSTNTQRRRSRSYRCRPALLNERAAGAIYASAAPQRPPRRSAVSSRKGSRLQVFPDRGGSLLNCPKEPTGKSCGDKVARTPGLRQHRHDGSLNRTGSI